MIQQAQEYEFVFKVLGELYSELFFELFVLFYKCVLYRYSFLSARRRQVIIILVIEIILSIIVIINIMIIILESIGVVFLCGGLYQLVLIIVIYRLVQIYINKSKLSILSFKLIYYKAGWFYRGYTSQVRRQARYFVDYDKAKKWMVNRFLRWIFCFDYAPL